MSWGNPLGFSSGPTPFEMANTSGVGEDCFEMRLRPSPTSEHPNRARVSFPCGRAILNDADAARTYLTTEQSSTIYAAAAYYLGWLQGKGAGE